MTTPTTPSDDLEAAAKAATEGPGPLTLLADREWLDLCEKDDRTSPEDCPEMCLITRNELGGIISEGFLLAKERDAVAHRALEAKVVELADELADAHTALDEQDVPTHDEDEFPHVAPRLSLVRRIVHVLSERLADKAKIAELEGERDAWKEVCRYAGICMACARGNLREPCTDCLGTGWNYGVPAEVLEAQAALRASQEALGKAVEALKRILDPEIGHVGPFAGQASIFARQTLAQVEGGGEDKGAARDLATSTNAAPSASGLADPTSSGAEQ